MSYKSASLLSVKGAKYNQRADDIKERIPERIITPSSNSNGHYNNFFLQQQAAAAKAQAQPQQQQQQQQQHQQQQQQQQQTTTTMLTTSQPTTLVAPSTSVDSSNSGTRAMVSEKYWKMDDDGSRGDGDMVVIHVCDENQQISKDFCCKRDILVKHMKYFEKFLAENENGYDDIDISVHCDVEIFEWLMKYIHEPNRPPKIEKAIIVSILISSEFLQMDALVDLCVQQVAGNLSEIIKLPIDLSCISERLVNRIAFITQPKTLSETKDRKDKILTKLYKRRVELDFSRKGSTAPRSGSFTTSTTATAATTDGTPVAAAAVSTVPPASTRTIAASLTCCRHCGLAYLDNYVSLLTCRASPPTVDFRGQLASRHSAIVGWSLTSYLKTLHSGGMGWDAIYWHVWAACVVFRVDGVMISALEVDRYAVEPDGLLIRGSPPRDENSGVATGDSSADGGMGLLGGISPKGSVGSGSGGGGGSGGSAATSPLPPRPPPLFSLSLEDDFQARGQEPKSFKLRVCKRPELVPANPATTSSLNPARPPEILTQEIFDLICTQMKYIVGLSHKLLIQKTMKAAVDAARSVLPARAVDFGELLWRNPPRCTTYEGSVIAVEVPVSAAEAAAERRRGRSPGRGARALPAESRKYSMSLPKNSSARTTVTTVAGGIASTGSNGNKMTSTTSPTAGNIGQNNADLGNTSNDSDQDTPSTRPPAGGATNAERRSRSSSTGARLSTLSPGVSGSARNLKRMMVAPPLLYSTASADDSSVDEESASIPPAAVLNGAYLDHQAAKQIAVLQSLPPEMQVRIFQTKGPVYGQWMVVHPLQVRAASHAEALRTVEESSIIAAKKQEWALDIMREWDEKRMEVYERFLVSRRSRPADQATAAGAGVGAGEGRRPVRKNNKPSVEYYRDRGRQASNR